MDALGIAVIVAVLAVATAIGLWHRRTDGLIRDESAEKKRRAAILAAAGLELVDLPDRSPKSKSENATTAAKAASGAAAAAVHAMPPEPHAGLTLVRPEPGDAPAETAAVPGGSTGVPTAPLGQTTEPAAVLSEPAAVPSGPDAVPVGRAEAGAGQALVPGGSGVVPDVREEPGVVEDGSRDVGDAGEQLDRGLLDRLGVGPAQATLLQFSSAFCAPCRAVRRVSGEVAELLPGVRHVEVDAESHLDEVRALKIWRTPTLLILDAGGHVVKRATGVPSKPQLIAAVAGLLQGAGKDESGNDLPE
jgi:thiol-disulfide isomerase/thioredoxin